MRANRINLYDLDAVNTTIVLRELPYNPDVQCITLFDLNAVPSTIVLNEVRCYEVAGVNVTVNTLTGELTLTGYAPTVSVTSGTVDPTNRHTVPSAYFKYVKTVARGQRVKVVRSFEV